MTTITHERLLELLVYDPETGIFTNKIPRKKCSVGKSPGTQRPDGYRLIMLDGKSYLESRLAWFYMTKNWPIDEIDHIDCNPSNNRWENLREATRAQNEHNKSIRSDNTTGYKGVTRGKGNVGYCAWLCHKRKTFLLGTYPTIEEAVFVRRLASTVVYGEYVRHG